MAPTLLSKVCLSATAFLTFVNAVPYALYESYSGAAFYDNFDFITSDPSGGWVTYVDQATAQGLGYASASASGAYLGVDSTSYLDPAGAGRRSVRIESKESFNQGLFIGDFNHMPWGCGTWPAFWMYGPNWPYEGEIDILEGVNQQATNQISGHSSSGCTISGSNSNAQFVSANCYDPVANSGCYFVAHGAYTYGQNFNSVGGGVYAMQWTSNWISVWFWRRGTVPANVQNQQPDPATWGRPMAMFAGDDANIAGRFANMKIVLNTDFCGPWASNVWSGCPGSSCIDYVAGNPSAFSNAYWSVNSINIYHPTGPIPGAAAFFVNSTAPSATMIGSNPVFASSSILSFSTATPLASITSVFMPDAAMGATITPVVGPSPTSTPVLVTSLPFVTTASISATSLDLD